MYISKKRKIKIPKNLMNLERVYYLWLLIILKNSSCDTSYNWSPNRNSSCRLLPMMIAANIHINIEKLLLEETILSK